jgi:hypothetical protein
VTRAIGPVAALLFTVACLPALATDADLDSGLRRCANEGDPAQRLACFDAIVKRLPQVEADRVGMTADIRNKREPAGAAPARKETLTARIAALRQAPGGEGVFSLDNGQVWIATEARPGMSFAVGDPVRIEHGAMSSLWLVGEKHRKLRVRRFQ